MKLFACPGEAPYSRKNALQPPPALMTPRRRRVHKAHKPVLRKIQENGGRSSPVRVFSMKPLRGRRVWGTQAGEIKKFFRKPPVFSENPFCFLKSSRPFAPGGNNKKPEETFKETTTVFCGNLSFFRLSRQPRLDVNKRITGIIFPIINF